ncbi:hypothetical protein [Rhizobium tubonense]|uniref:Uncharacterized protein n=1 Tax=Rhizobium tubonense TaxID=484088 RepID=A0A2W4CCB2_9HYPH|nr:hypothetical protein [Rhizobium tubonense]PZM10451.1 hypothetical protein CPY51_23065 [Rhizobium tubonense]
MRLAVFTRNHASSARLLINPSQVLAVISLGNTTNIHVAVPSQAGHPFVYVVPESLQAVGHELNLAMAD